ncbi:protein MAIN-LIKE 2-like [Camellia sinensis]|uniref:protein MAIN-LIKE 2-like n=1 Tax=Camellia sinensis TaxID=4442 RepID=UPI001036ED63|nr:protein MAIN-LIKE 2-like [Camellia sinensis]
MDFEYQQCVPPTASNRRRRELDVDHERGRWRGRERGRGRGRDRDPVSEEYLTHAFPGGLNDPSILRSFNNHVVAAIWHKEEREPLKCHNHSSKILAWPWWSVDKNTKFKAIIEQSGLSQLARCTYRFVNKLLTSSFVERWQPETNTFHMTIGEMTLTLDDVGNILSLPIVGRLVSVPNVTDYHGVTLLVFGLGITELVAHEEISTTGVNSVRLEWLRSQFVGITDSDPNEVIQCAARAYLLFLLGCTLSSDKSGGKVPVVYLSLLMDLGSIRTYDWGAAALVFLYRQLGYASRSGVKQMGGYMTLLEAWIYEHFRAFRPHQNMG